MSKDSKSNEWQDISTAPIDGTRVILFEDGHIGIGTYTSLARDDNGKVIGLERHDLKDYWEWDGEGFHAYPTYWMALPDVP